MKRLCVCFLLLAISQVAWPQIETGTVILIMWDENEVTIGADSRATANVTGAHNDCYCKIAAFGDKFFFTFSGLSADDSHQWSADSVAFNAWRRESIKKHATARDLVHAVAERWTARMKNIYTDPGLLHGHGDTPMLGQPVFGATDAAGNIAISTEDVVFDPVLFRSAGKIKISVRDFKDLTEGNRLILGRTEIIEEYLRQTSDRARKDAAKFKTATVSLNPSDWRAALVSHLITRAVELDTHRDEISLPVDIVQLQATFGLDVRGTKPSCRKYDPKHDSKPCPGGK